MSGRREAQVMADARLLAQTSYIYEAGCGVIHRRRADAPDRRLAARRRRDAGREDAGRGNSRPPLRALRRPARVASPLAPRPPLSHLFRGRVDVAEANALLAERGHDDLRFLDNGAIARPMEGLEGLVTPTTWSPAAPARRRPSPSTYALAATRRTSASRSATRSRTSTPPRRWGASSWSPTARSATPACARRSAGAPTSPSPRAATGDGVYEAVISTLAEGGRPASRAGRGVAPAVHAQQRGR